MTKMMFTLPENLFLIDGAFALLVAIFIGVLPPPMFLNEIHHAIVVGVMAGMGFGLLSIPISIRALVAFFSLKFVPHG